MMQVRISGADLITNYSVGHTTVSTGAARRTCVQTMPSYNLSHATEENPTTTQDNGETNLAVCAKSYSSVWV